MGGSGTGKSTLLSLLNGSQPPQKGQITINGHDFKAIDKAVQKAKKSKGMPTAIIAKTVKGKGVSFMENQVNWHGAAPNAEQAEQALAELQAELSKLEGK